MKMKRHTERNSMEFQLSNERKKTEKNMYAFIQIARTGSFNFDFGMANKFRM